MGEFVDQQGRYIPLAIMFIFFAAAGVMKMSRRWCVGVFLTGFALLGLALFTELTWLAFAALPLIVISVAIDIVDEWREDRANKPPRRVEFRDFQRPRRRWWQDSPPPRHEKSSALGSGPAQYPDSDHEDV